MAIFSNKSKRQNNKALKKLQLATKLVEKFCYKGPPKRFAYLKTENKAFPSLPPPCNVVLLFGIPIENSKHLNFEWRGGERGVNCFVLKVTQFEDNVSSILSPIVDDGNSPWEVLTAYISHNIDHILHLGWWITVFSVSSLGQDSRFKIWRMISKNSLNQT